MQLCFQALDYMRTDKNAEPDSVYIKDKLTKLLEQNPGKQVYVTQGFICRNAYGEIDNLQRGGSDYTASLVGAAINADEIQIWTDIDGMHNNDPRVVDKTDAVRQAAFRGGCRIGLFWSQDTSPDMCTTCQIRRNTGTPTQHNGSYRSGNYHKQRNRIRQNKSLLPQKTTSPQLK